MATDAPGTAPLPAMRVVGIGSSAGGLEALTLLVGQLEAMPGVCFVVAQHMSPRHTSLLTGLLAPRTHLEVRDVVDGVEPEQGVVYVTPPNHDAVWEDGCIRLEPPTAGVGPKPSVDRLFESLAAQLGDHAVGVVLSGTGSDGSAGIRAIKMAGGLSVVQEPRTAKYDGMPRAAMLTGNIDLILPPAEIGPAVAQVLSRMGDGLEGPLPEDSESDLERIYRLVHTRTGFRLADYKNATVRRRIGRRMGLRGVGELGDYADLLRSDSEEARLLVAAASVSVTSFFRDPGAFAALEASLRSMLADDQSGDLIRCWVPGCATGEEVYSIAMLLEKLFEDAKGPSRQYLIFGSDIDEEALAIARSGRYPAPIFSGVPEPLIERFTSDQGDHRRVHKRLRNRVVFARQNVIEDPPFARMHLVSCRNLLIYLVPTVQRRVLETIHYALRDGGLLLLGRSETVDRTADHFTAIDSTNRLYRQVPGVPKSSNTPSLVARIADRPSPRRRAPKRVSLAERVSGRLLEQFAPPSVMIDGDDRVVHVHGDVSPHLGFPAGDVDLFLFDMVDPRMRAELRALVYRCRRRGESAAGRVWPLRNDASGRYVSLSVTPMEPGGGAAIVVSFVPAPAPVLATLPADDEQSLVVQELERELSQARSHLGVVVEELETSNEELQALNEELQSTNEELQSTNEEFQTSNEELQSSNEELLTVNEELTSKAEELSLLGADLRNVKESLDFPLMVVDLDLVVTRTNAACSEVLVDARRALGRPLHRLAWTLPVPGIESAVVDVIEGEEAYTTLLLGSGDRYFRLAIMPYRRDRGEVAGAVLIVQEITERVRAERQRRETEERLRAFIENSPTRMWIRDRDGVLQYANRRYRQHGNHATGDGTSIDWSQHTAEVMDALTGGPEATPPALFEDRRTELADGRVRWWREHYFMLWEGTGEGRLGSVSVDITERQQHKQQLEQEEARLRLALEAAQAGTFAWRPATDDVVASVEALTVVERQSVVEARTVRWADWWTHESQTKQASMRAALRRAVAHGESFEISWKASGPSEPDHRYVTAVGRPSTDGHGDFIGIVLDCTASHWAKAAERARLAGHARSEAKDAFLATMSHELRTPLNAILGYAALLGDDLSTGQARVDLDRLSTAARGMLGLINDILDLSKLEAGALRLRLLPFRMSAVLDAATAVAEPLARAKSLSFRIDVSPAALEVMLLGDAGRIEQVLVNLVSNAIKFTDTGGVTVQVSTLAGQAPGECRVVLVVHDTGRGIDADQQEHIFERFGQLETDPSTERSGTGLGLAICRQLVAQMDGQISVSSVVGEGSTFRVELPLAEVPAGRQPGPESAVVPEPGGLTGVTIVVVDDNLLNRDVTRRLLEKRGATVFTFEAARPALALLQRVARGEARAVDAVLMDIQMPDMDGVEATRQLRGIAELAHLPVVGLSASIVDEERTRALSAGMNAFVSKPFRLDDLVAVLLDHIGTPSEPTPWADLDGIDGDRARDLMVGDWDLFRESLAMLVEHLWSQTPALKRAVGDFPTVGRLFHGVAGAASVVAARDLEQAAREGMAAARAFYVDGVQASVERVLRESTRLSRLAASL